MSAFCEDVRQLAKYPNGIIGKPRDHDVPLIECLQWSDTQQGKSSFASVQDFINAESASQHALRVAFLPIAPVSGDESEAEEFRTLFKHYSVPTAVPAERMRNVGFSFGTLRNRKEKPEAAWFHFLCRKVEILDGKIQDLGYLRHGNDNGPKADPAKMWTMCDFFLHTKPGSANDSESKIVTLLCFGAPDAISNRFASICDQTAWKDVLAQPYLIFDVLFDELHGVFDSAVWELSQAVNPEEKMALERAGGDGKHESSLSFQNLHNIQKNSTFMIEAAEASIIMLEAMIARLLRNSLPSDLTLDTADALDYRKRSFQSTLLRLHSLEKRMSNVIQLSFNLVTQADSGVMKADSAVLKTDSRAMKFIAFLTLVFLPATGVASVFSTPFFDVDWESPGTNDRTLRTATSFWIFWAVVLPLTLVGLLLCFAWVNLPEDYKVTIKAYVGKLAKSGRERRMKMTRINSRAFGKADVERGGEYGGGGGTRDVEKGNDSNGQEQEAGKDHSAASCSPQARSTHTDASPERRRNT